MLLASTRFRSLGSGLLALAALPALAQQPAGLASAGHPTSLYAAAYRPLPGPGDPRRTTSPTGVAEAPAPLYDDPSNVRLGGNAGQGLTTGTKNVLVGLSSGLFTKSGSYNVFTGFQSGQSTSTGDANTFSGAKSGANNGAGHFNSALGYDSGPATDALANTTSLGNGAVATASNTIQLGNADITGLRCKVGLTATSDARFKYDVQANVPGLAFINRLRPVTYRFDDARLATFERTGTLAARSLPDAAAPLRTGFVAQEVEAAAQALRFRFDGVHAPATARDSYGLGYAQFVVPLVQAVQELSGQLDALQVENAALKAHAAQAEADHASLLTLQAQMARLLGQDAQAQK